MDQFKAHSLSWAEAVDKLGLGPRLSLVMDEVAAIIGDEVPTLASGVLSQHVDLSGSETSTTETRSLPNLYDAIVVTGRFIVLTWGHLPADAAGIERESTSVWARKNISQVTVEHAPGQIRYPGCVATHHDIVVRFVDGTDVQIPNMEEDLTQEGKDALVALIPEFYADMSA